MPSRSKIAAAGLASFFVVIPKALAMYNGIGLRTVRGTATNGYVQKNMSYVKPAMVRAKTGKSGEDWGSAVPKARKPCADIQEHDRKRQIEVKLIELQESLEEKGCVKGWVVILATSLCLCAGILRRRWLPAWQ